MSSFRKGDIVTIQGTVMANYTPGIAADGQPALVRVRPYSHYETIYLDPQHVVVEVPYFESGDQVIVRNVGAATVIATDFDTLWCRDIDGNRHSVYASDVHLAPEEGASA